MNTDNKLNNQVFKDAIVGVLLFIGAFAFSLSNQAQLKTMQAPYIAILAILTTGSLFLLGKSIKKDRIEIE